MSFKNGIVPVLCILATNMEVRSTTRHLDSALIEVRLPMAVVDMKRDLCGWISDKQRLTRNHSKPIRASERHRYPRFRGEPSTIRKNSSSRPSPITETEQYHTMSLERYELCTSLFDSSELVESKLSQPHEEKDTLLSSRSPSDVVKVPFHSSNQSQHEIVRSLRYKQREIITSRIVSGEINHTKELLLEYSACSMRTRRVRVPVLKKHDTSVIAELNSLTGIVKKQLSLAMGRNHHLSPFVRKPPTSVTWRERY